MIRQFVLFVCAAMALLGSVIAIFASAQQRDFELRGYADATRTSDLPFRVPRLGVNASLEQYDALELERQFAQMQAAGVIWVRQFAYWNALEPDKGKFSWETWDRLVTAARAYPRLQIIPVLMNTPPWARSGAGSSSPTSPPDNPDDFGKFARAFAARYADDLHYYQVWDEPNLTAAWGNMNPRPAHYTAMLRAVYEAIHSADEGASVIAAALAPTTETGPANLSDILYLRQLYALGAGEAMDAVAAKPYGFNFAPSDRRVDESLLNFSRIIALREVMVAAGDGKKPLWASSWGWNSLPPDWVGPPSIWGSVSPDQQALYTLEAIDRAEREWPWLAGMILYHWQPAAPLDDPVWGFALNDPGGSFGALLQRLEQRETPRAAANGLYFPATPYARYSGVWTFGRLGADIGWINDSQFEFDFWGRDVSLLLRRDNYVAYLYPTIDGLPANMPPKDAAGNAYILLTSDTLSPDLTLVPVARGLTLKTHTLQVKADDLVPDEAQDRWALAGFAVSSGDLAAPYERQILVAMAAAVAAGIAVIVTGWPLPWSKMMASFSALWARLSETSQFVLSVVATVALLVGMLLTWNAPMPAVFRRDSVQLGLAFISAGLIYLEPGIVLVVLAAFVLLSIFYRRVDYGLTLTLFWAPFFLFPVELYRFAFPMAEILILLTLLAWVLRGLAAWARARQSANSAFSRPPGISALTHLNRMDWAVLAWVGLGVLSLSWAVYRAQAVTELRVLIVEPALFYMILRATPLNRAALIRLVDVLLISGLLVAVIGFALYLQGEAIITAEGGAGRLASVYGSPNNVGLFLGRCFPFALAFVLVKTDRLRRLFGLFGLAIMLTAVILSQSAGALFIGIPAAGAAMFIIIWGRRGWLAAGGLAAAAVGFALAALQSARFARLLDFTSGTNFARIRVWQSALNIIHDHPLTGLGLDQFLYAFRGKYILPDAWQEPNLSHPHNFVLDFWVRLGIVGAAVLAWLQISFWGRMLRAYRLWQERDPYQFALTAGTMGSMINLLSHGLVDNSVYVNDLAFVFALLLGMAVQLSNARAIDDDVNKMV